MEERFVVYQSKMKQVGLVILALIMVLASFFILFIGKPVFILVGVVGTLFFGYAAFYLMKQLFAGKKLVVLTEQGFYDYSSALATKERLIPWDEVAHIEEVGIVNQDFVSIYLKHPEQVLTNLSKVQRAGIKANVKMGFGEINITLQSAKKFTNEALIEEMLLYVPVNYEEGIEKEK